MSISGTAVPFCTSSIRRFSTRHPTPPPKPNLVGLGCPHAKVGVQGTRHDHLRLRQDASRRYRSRVSRQRLEDDQVLRRKLSGVCGAVRVERA